MVNIEIDGKQVSVSKGSTIMDGAKQIGIYIPHFCYHKKLSIAANCRMCLVQVEKAPKPLPACATPVMDGMKVYTHSQQAVAAQKGVMEFLLINHPLDCPICDQGGECQLQDLAVGYGSSGSRYSEAKRVVVNKNLGPLISTDMTRCIHCTRCVRFGQEIAGIMELGMAGRGEHAEILAFVGKTVDSELSGNVIDLCPVGALVSKPFRYSARTWELSRRKSVSPHCGLGSNLVVQVKQNRVMRVLPRENEEINECWLSDKDRFSYEGLNSEDRLIHPMIKRNGEWFECDWQEALEITANALQAIKNQYGANKVAALGSAHSTTEELYLLQKLLRGFGSNNIDHRLRQSDFSADMKMQGVPWLGTSIADISQLKSALIIGSTLRKDHPLIAQRLRQAAKNGMQLNIVNPVDDDLLVNVASKIIVVPSLMIKALAEILKAVVEIKGIEQTEELQRAINSLGASNTTSAFAIASSLIENTPAAIYLGNIAQHHPDYAKLNWLTGLIAKMSGASYGVLGEASNSVGAFLAGAIPRVSAATSGLSITERSNQLEFGLNAAQLLGFENELTDEKSKAFILMNVEPEYDSYNSQQALETIKASEFVVSLSAYQGNAKNYADVILPITPFTETSGTYVNTEGRVQSFNGVVSPLGEARPAWKVLRVLANLLSLEKFDYETTEQIRAEIFPDEFEICRYLNNNLENFETAISIVEKEGIERIGEVPIYQADPIVRRAESLQATHDAELPKAWMSAGILENLGIVPGDKIKVRQGEGLVQLEAALDEKLPPNCVRIACAHPKTAALGALFGEVKIEKL
ncbi:NADH-quinone oxidoreductase subunit NuoG [Nitrosomonas supralitoralis]|uniref:NADH-quinone oxidoreductase n=1 Tax=Nitrosomonas supralitoralis TaxID=2116706 RepID=A0A2P7NTG4_9PROT|nr:NADH-quinone oxidoreductase subunit NuoG [Nitrosomonas supralitoralis]PSJ16761.1 NADH-quinone oxidoreductase subunit G [Nitrosomonas supralitoralis]